MKLDQRDIDDLSVEVSDDFVRAYVAEKFSPEEVFPDDELERWAEANGFTRG